MMTRRERVLAVLAGKRPDRVPWMGDLDRWVSWLTATGRLPSQYMNPEGLLRLHCDLGVGFYLQGYYPFRTDLEGVKVIQMTENRRTCTEVVTPLGSVRQVSTSLPQSFSSEITERFVKTPDDLRVIRSWHERRHFQPHYEPAMERALTLKEHGVVLCYIPRSPLMEMITVLAGTETVTSAWNDARKELEATLGVMEQKADEAALIALESPAECLMIPENLSSSVLERRLYEAYVRGYQERWVCRIREAGKYSLIHFHGTLRGLVREVSATGVDVIEAVTPAPVGDIPIGQTRDWVGERTIIWGGLPRTSFSDSLSDEEFDELLLRTLEVMRGEPRYVLGVGDQVPPFTRWERIRRVAEMVEMHGAY